VARWEKVRGPVERWGSAWQWDIHILKRQNQGSRVSGRAAYTRTAEDFWVNMTVCVCVSLGGQYVTS